MPSINESHDRVRRTAVAVAAVAVAAMVPVAGAGAMAQGAGTPAGHRITGSVHTTEIFTYVGPSIAHSHNLIGHDIWTGVLGDHGPSTTTSPTATVETLHFTRGAVKVDDKGYFESAARVYPGGESTCSQSGTYAPGRVRVIGGTGAYAGVTGTLIYSGSFSTISPRGADGTCDFSKATSVIAISTGAGRVSY